MRCDAWSDEQNAIIEQHYMLPGAVLLPMVNAAGPKRSAGAVQTRRGVLGLLKTPRPCGSLAGLDRLIAEMAQQRGVTLADLHGPSRRPRIVAVRQAIMVTAYATGRWSLITVGKAMHRDHTTVMHAVRKSRALREAEAA